jgi:hypothetical protein
MVEGQDVGDGVIEIFGLVEECLSMESGDILVEVHGEKVQWPLACTVCTTIMAIDIMVMVGSFGSKRSDLLVATGISWNEEYGHAFDLHNG